MFAGFYFIYFFRTPMSMFIWSEYTGSGTGCFSKFSFLLQNVWGGVGENSGWRYSFCFCFFLMAKIHCLEKIEPSI